MKTILIVEDEFTIAELLEMVLVDEGYRVLLASNGRQGLERLAEERPNLVISDYMMPLLDGASLFRIMRESDEQRDIPFIFMSSMPEANLRERVNGFAAFVRKPFHLTAMVQLISTVLGAAGPTTPTE